MLKTQSLQIEQSEKREALNKLLGIESEKLTDEERGSMDELSKRLVDIEPELRAALALEGTEAKEFEQTGEGAEVRSLLQQVTLNDYLDSAVNGIGTKGAAIELNDALDLPMTGKAGIAIPWNVLEVRQVIEPGTEKRAFTDTGDYAGGVAQRPILQRLFGPGIMDLLGVRIDSVPAGRTEWPLITAGVAPDMKTEGDAATDAVPATFGTETLKPKRLTGKYEYTHEQAAQVPDIEQALRRDLADAVKSKMNSLVLLGDEDTNSQEPDGFFTTIAAPSAPSGVADFADYAGLPALGVNGIHASMEAEVNVLLGTNTYRHAAGIYATNSDFQSAIETLNKRCMKCMASSYVTDPASNVQQALLHSAGSNGGAMRGDSIAAVWPALEVVRDIYSQASQGVSITWVTLWDCQTAFREASYVRTSF